MWRVPAVAIVAVVAAHAACAQVLPGRPITVVVPFPPGASADAIMRLITHKITENTGQQFVIDNRTGGAASVSAIAVKQAPPDGHTLLELVVGTHAQNQKVGSEVLYDVRRDFEPITQLWNFPLTLAVPASSPARSVAELVALGKSKPGGLSYASTAVNSAGHLLGAMLSAASATPMVHIPYRGAPPALTDLVAGRVDFYFASYASVGPFVAAGTLRMLAVSSAHRLKALPDLPTMGEAGYPSVELGARWGVVAPAKTPPDVIRKLNEAFVAAANDPDVVRRMEEQGVEIATNSPEQFKALIEAEVEQLERAVKSVESGK